MQAMILAAGFGTRLLPYTKYRPKPLFPLLNHSLLILQIMRLKRYGFTRIIVNAHHLQEQIAEALEGIAGIILQREEVILGTGGGLRAARDKMDDSPLLIVNGDIYHTIDVARLYYEHQQREDCTVTLALHDYPRFNAISVGGDRLAGFSKGQGGEMLAFTGVHVISPAILDAIPSDKESCIITRYKELAGNDLSQFQIVRVDRSFWTDMGTPEDYLALHEGLLSGDIPLWPELEHTMHAGFVVDKAARIPDSTIFEDWVSIGNATLGKNVIVRRSVIWDDAVIPDNTVVEDAIVAR